MLQIAHDNLLQYGSTDLQALLQITGEGGAWSNPILTALLTGQATNPDEGLTFLLFSFNVLDDYFSYAESSFEQTLFKLCS